MNKSDLIDHIAAQAAISKADAERALTAALDGIRRTLKKGNTIQMLGFGSFSVGRRAGRTGRNPRTGESVIISATRVVKFKPGKHLKDAVN